MTMIFREYAPRYWAAGLQAIPLIPNEKRPAIYKWQTWSQQKISDADKAAWLDSYATGNIGIPAGPASGLCFIDIDVTGEQLALIEGILPKTPWRRVGAKGAVLAFKYNGAKSFKIIIPPNTKPVVEFFSTSGQIVLPPSIHPDTGKPYQATCELYEVLDQIPAID